METLLVFLCIFGLCIVTYGLTEMYLTSKEYPLACKVIYIPEKETSIQENYLRRHEKDEFTKDQGDFTKYDYLQK